MTVLFVHGALRPGQPEFWRIERYTSAIETITLPGYQLYDDGEGLLLPTGNPQDTVVGELITLDPNAPEALMEALGRFMMMKRNQNPELLSIQLPGRDPFNAWAYIIDEPRGYFIPEGDWDAAA